MPRRPQPLDDLDEVWFIHCSAATGRTVWAAPDVEKNGTARTRHRRVGVVPDLEKPFIGKVSVAHFLFFKPRGNTFPGVDHHMPIVEGIGWIVRPRIPSPHLVVGNTCTRRGLGRIAIELANRKASGGSPAIPLLLELSPGVEQGTPAPGKPLATQQYGNGTGKQGLLPGRTCLGFVKDPESPPMTIPIRGCGNQQLANIRRQFGWQLGISLGRFVATQDSQDLVLFRHY